jgi:hypothetical protein
VKVELEDANASVSHWRYQATELQTQLQQALVVGATTAYALEKGEQQLKNSST